jgi:hypothetical protein
MHDLRSMGETNIIKTRMKLPISRNLLKEVTKQYHDNFTDNNGRIKATFDLIFLTGWAPSVSQQKPLKPGSAQKRLADALGTLENNPEKD